jgi:hypothetical protein
MDLYTFSLVLGAVGLGAMGAGGFARHVGTQPGPHGPGHAAGGHGLAHSGPSSALGKAIGPASSHHATGAPGGIPAWVASFLSPRVAFGVLLGLGTAGVLLRGHVPGALRFVLALALGLAFDRWLLTPLWNFSLRFASKPALTLETAVTGEARAVTAFDAQGHGIVQIDLDGQLVQVLATLSSKDRALGHRVRAGEALRVEDVDAKRNRCSVTLL